MAFTCNVICGHVLLLELVHPVVYAPAACSMVPACPVNSLCPWYGLRRSCPCSIALSSDIIVLPRETHLLLLGLFVCILKEVKKAPRRCHWGQLDLHFLGLPCFVFSFICVLSRSSARCCSTSSMIVPEQLLVIANLHDARPWGQGLLPGP